MTEIPLYPPTDWFSPPEDMPSDAGCIVQPDGRIYGYVFQWGAVLMDGSEDRWTPPKSKHGYAYAHVGDTQLEDGTMIKTANLGGDAGHAPVGAGDLAQIQDFYENTQTQLGRIRYGEDEHGVWFAGALWPNVSEFDIAKLRASARSGHWAVVGDWKDLQSGRAGYELVGACLVNVPGLKYARADRAASGVLSFNPVAMSGGADHEGAMVALFLHPDVQNTLAVEGGEPASDLHITLAYFDSSANDRADWSAIHDLVSNVGAKHLPLAGKVQGRGEFYAGDGIVHWASPDVPGLEAMRQELVAALDLAGFEVRKDHGYTPHITIRYDAAAGQEPPDVPVIDVSFDSLVLAVGGDMTTLSAQPDRAMQRVASGGTAQLATAAKPVDVGGTLVVEGVPTEDGRLIPPGATTWRTTPLPLYASLENLPGHSEADLVGRIDTIWRDTTDPTLIKYSGVIFPDSGSGTGQQVIDAIANESLRGVSIDGICGPEDYTMNDAGVEVMDSIVIAGATLTPMPAIAETTVTLLSTVTVELSTEGTTSMTDVQVVEETVDEALADQTVATDATTALADQLASVADRVEYLIGLVEQSQMAARLAAVNARLGS